MTALLASTRAGNACHSPSTQVTTATPRRSVSGASVASDAITSSLMLVAMCFALCLVPVAMTRSIHPAPMHPAPLEPLFFMRRVPQSLTTVLSAGMIIGSFYGLAPLYAAQQGLSTEHVGLFMASCIGAGLIVQGPLGKLSDRYDRAWLIRGVARCIRKSPARRLLSRRISAARAGLTTPASAPPT